MRGLRARLLPLGAALLTAAALGACGGGSASSKARRAKGITSPPTAPAATQTLPSGVGSTATRTGASQTVTLTQTTTSSPPPTRVPPRCTAKDLGIHLLQSLGAAGTSYVTFAFINVTHGACSLRGYPGVSLVLASGAVDDITNDRTPRAVRVVVVSPGGEAPFVVGVVGNAAPRCVQAADFRFIPPNDTAYEQIHAPMQVCGGHVSVTPVGQTQ